MTTSTQCNVTKRCSARTRRDGLRPGGAQLRHAGSVVMGLSIFLIGAPAWAATRHVENWGVDSGSCGTAAAPCRTIGQAVALAVAGDTILVGPGLYGDTLGEPAGGIVLSNAVTVKSTHGAAATLIKYTGA